MPVHANRQGDQPYIVATDNALYCFNRDHFLSGDIKAYWGPAQPLTYDEYAPPTKWPKAGTLLSIPKSVRFIWQTADLDGEAILVGGFTGTFIFGSHLNEHNVDATGPPGTFPVHEHFTYPWQLGSPSDYGISFNRTFSGHLDVPSGGSFDTTGNDLTWYGLGLVVPPYSRVDYHAPNSITAGAIQAAYDSQFANFTPAEPDPGSPLTLPPFIASVPNGPFSVGMSKELLTGRYSVDGTIYDIGEGINYGVDPLTTEVGYLPPFTRDATLQPQNWATIAQNLETLYSNSTSPYVNSYQMSVGTNAFAQFFTPYELPYLGCESIHIIVLAKPYQPTDFAFTLEVERIKKAYKYLKLYKVYVFYDRGYLEDCFIPDTVTDTFESLLADFCSQLSDFGWSFEGPLDYKDPEGAQATFLALIEENFPTD